MNAFRTHAVVQDDGKVVVDHIPLKTGQHVEVLVLSPDLATLPDKEDLRSKLLAAPCLTEEELSGVEEVREWLANWPNGS
jgi:hypothetical protein